MNRTQVVTPGADRSRREEILEIAARVIAERGLAGATVRDIGKAAGILSGSLYHHFESKEQIVLELLESNVASLLADAERRRFEGGDASDVLASLVRASVLETAKHPHESLILRNETRAFSESPTLAPLADLRRRSVALWLDVVSEGIAGGEFRSDLDPEVVVFSIVDSVLGAARWFVGDRTKQVDVVVATLVSTHVDALGVTSA